MLRVVLYFFDLGIFLALGYLVDFKRGIFVFYIYKLLALLSVDEN